MLEVKNTECSFNGSSDILLCLDTDDVTTHSCTLLWTPPSDNGGTEIIRYNVEQREVGRHTWARLGSVKAAINKFDVTKLTEGKEYEFQVKLYMALNVEIKLDLILEMR